MVRRPLRYVFAACVAAGAILACGPGFLDGISGGTRDAGAADSAVATTDAGSCNHAEVPAAPAGTDSPTDITLPVFAFDTMRLDTLQSNDSGVMPQGLDIDTTCTCESQKDSCVRPADAGPACDGPDGRDNQLATLFDDLAIAVPDFPTSFATSRIRTGHFSILVDLLGWNGTPNDPAVQVALRQSPKLDVDDAGVPQLDGTDRWTVDPNTIGGGTDAIGKDCSDPVNAFACIALIRDTNAYVTNGELVASPRVPGSTDPVELTLRTSVGDIHLGFQDFMLRATISGPVNGFYRLDGELTGRVPVTSLLAMFGNLQDFTQSDTTKAVCNNPIVFATAKGNICSLRDLSLSGDPTAPCDAVSAAISFSAGAANAGTVYQDQPLASQCSDAGFTCDTP